MRFDVPEQATEQLTVTMQLTPSQSKLLDAMHEVAKQKQPGITREETAAYALKQALPMLAATSPGRTRKETTPTKPNGARSPQSAAKP